MTLTEFCSAHWPAIQSMTRDESLLRPRLLPESSTPSQRLPEWAEYELLPRLRELRDQAGLDGLSDSVLLAAGLLAYFAGRPLDATPPPPELLARLETHLFDPATGAVLPVKHTPETPETKTQRQPKSKKKAAPADAPPAQPWVGDLVQRLLALGCGWERPSVHPAPAADPAPAAEERSNPVPSTTEPSSIEDEPSGWDCFWPRAELEMIYLTVPGVRTTLETLAQSSPGVAHYLRAKWFGRQDPKAPQEAEKHLELAVGIVHRFLGQCPDPKKRQNQYLFLEFWNPGKSGLTTWVRTMLRGSTQARYQVKSFAVGQIYQQLTAEYRRELKGDTPSETVLRLALKEVAVHHCLNPECLEENEPQPALAEVCKTCETPFKPVFFSIPGILVTEAGWPFHEERDFVRCMMDEKTMPEHYVEAWEDPEWVAVLKALAAEARAAEAGNLRLRDRGLTVSDLVISLTITQDRVGRILKDLVRQKIVIVSGESPNERYRLTNGAPGQARLFQPWCPLHSDDDRFSPRNTKLWVQHPEGGKIPTESPLDPLSDRIGDPFAEAEDDEDASDQDECPGFEDTDHDPYTEDASDSDDYK